MKLTKNLKIKILQRFKEGEPMSKISQWYGVQEWRVESVVREAMIVADRQDKPLTAVEISEQL